MNPWPRQSIVPAAMTPFATDLKLDRDSLQRHIAELAVDGVTGILVCGHAGQITALSPEERKAVIADAVAASDVPIGAGVFEGSAGPELQQALDAAEAGASALLVWPTPAPDGADPIAHVVDRLTALQEASSLPIIWFLLADQAWSAAKLAAIVTAPGVMAVKECSETPSTFQRNRLVIQKANPDAAIWTTHSRWLLADLAMGADGILSSMGSVVPELHVALHAAVQRGDLPEARSVADRLFPLADLFYRKGHNNARFKRALKLLGRLTCDVCRPPEVLVEEEGVELEQLMRAAKLLG